MSESVNQHEAGYRTYEIFQRERVHEATPLIKPGQVRSAEFLADPYPLLAILREHYPCYRDWSGNSFWITRYDDVTSVLADDASYETRPKRWFYGLEDYGHDLGDQLAVLTRWTENLDRHAPTITESILAELVPRGEADLASELAARLPLEILARSLALPVEDTPRVARLFVAMQRGVHWEPRAQQAGRDALDELSTYLQPLVEKRRADPGDDVLSALATVTIEGEPATGRDAAITLLEADHETLHGALANMWFLLLTHPDQLAQITANRRMVKFAYLETLRHSTPVLSQRRFTTREVERFGRLLPLGALVMCSAAAANRDPRVFADPDAFVVARKDLCQREPRGQYRADGLPSGIAPALGPPSKHPALPADRPRSLYAVTRDTATLVSNHVLDALGDLRLASGASPTLASRRVGEMHTCWSLPVEFTPTR